MSRLMLTRSLHTLSRCPAVTNAPKAHSFHTSAASMTQSKETVDSATISNITQKEKVLTPEAPIKGGPTAQAQKHAGEEIKPGVVSDVAKGENNLTGLGEPLKGGPVSGLQSKGDSHQHTGALDSETISSITQKEKELTGESGPVKGGPTAQAQKHANEPITGQNLHDITEGEKKLAGDRTKGGPTATAQSELSKARS